MAQPLTRTSLQLWRQQSQLNLARTSRSHGCTPRVEHVRKRARIGPVLAAAATIEAPPAPVQPPPGVSSAPFSSQHSTSTSGRHQRLRPQQPAPSRAASDALATGLAVTWLGTSSGSPTAQRNVSCTVVRLPDTLFLVDCGEGSLRQLLQTDVNLAQVDAMLVTHLHGDHCFGIGSMLSAICAAKQRAAAANAPGAADASGQGLRVFGPPGVAELLRAALVLGGAGRGLTLPLTITEFVTDPADAHPAEAMDAAGMVRVARQAPEKAPEVPGLQERLRATKQPTPVSQYRRNDNEYEPFIATRGAVWTIPGRQATVRAAQLQHRVPCWGYVFEELLSPADTAANSQEQQQEQQEEEEAAQPAQQRAAPVQPLMRKILAARQSGAGLAAVAAASSAPSAARTRRSSRPRKVVILGDTMDSSAIAPLAVGADLLSHEATFQRGMESKAAIAQHSTAWMAGQFAAVIGARALVLTHFSARYHGVGYEIRGGDDHQRQFGRGRGGYEGGRGGRGRGGPSEERAAFAENSAEAQEAEAEQQQMAVQQLVQEAADMHPCGKVFAAQDMWTYTVPLAE